jgi:hypothetical protein
MYGHVQMYYLYSNYIQVYKNQVYLNIILTKNRNINE